MRSTGEIAAEIIEEIRNAKPTAEVHETLIYYLIDGLTWPGIREPKFGNRKQNKRYAEEVVKWIEDGHKLLAGRAGTFDAALLFREEHPDNASLDALFVTKSACERARSLKNILAGIRRQAKFIIDNEIGAHGNSGQDQKLTAELALGLVGEHGLPATYSSENSVYCRVARLGFEAITGRSFENGEDIRRACRVVAQENPELVQMLARRERPSKSAFGLAMLHISDSKLRQMRKSGDVPLFVEHCEAAVAEVDVTRR